MGGVNRHRAKDMQEIWESFEWLFREKLESLDYLTRRMIVEMQMTGVNMTQIRRFIPGQFEKLWDQVAKEQEQQNGRKSDEKASAV